MEANGRTSTGPSHGHGGREGGWEEGAEPADLAAIVLHQQSMCGGLKLKRKRSTGGGSIASLPPACPLACLPANCLPALLLLVCLPPNCLLALLPARLPALLPVCLPTANCQLPTANFLPACPPSCLSARLPACLPAANCLPTCPPSCLPPAHLSALLGTAGLHD
ncbi:hypothetical protein EYF80_040385 [Liparis tanakae]|uniref:Uncharacterized protein n=1 Tax=Liparis tanakae TaxID=230148 RepID=A0A4Z2G8H4_9TELE|nr:hypothetical protein EYF80_040385 [Liparis tanakae]